SGTTADAIPQATIKLNAKPACTLFKTPSPSTFTLPGQVVTYSYKLTNTGNTSISTISLSDDKIGPVSGCAATLAIGASTTCSASYTTTAADVTAGSGPNTATPHGTPASRTPAAASAKAPGRLPKETHKERNPERSRHFLQ